MHQESQHLLEKTVVDNRQEWRRLIRTVCENHDVKMVMKGEGERNQEIKKSRT